MVAALLSGMGSLQDTVATHIRKRVGKGFCSMPVALVLLGLLSLAIIVSQESQRLEAHPIIASGTTLHNPPRTLSGPKEGRVAVCLAGGAREFELNGPTLVKHLLGAYPHTDVFVSAPLTANSYKLWYLAEAPNVVAVRLRAQPPVPETDVELDILSPTGSPNGRQGLLHYFKLVEGCEDLIEAAEARYGVAYAWVLRTRTEGFWAAPPPPLASLDPSMFQTPLGSMYRGLNDRLGMGNRTASAVGNRRYSMLPELFAAGVRYVNSEGAFAAQLRVRGVPTAGANFSFCVVSRHQYRWPHRPDSVPVASLTSPTALNGAYCRPCTPAARGEASVRANKLFHPAAGALSDPFHVDFCNAQRPWEDNWQDIFDAAVGADGAAQRRRIVNLTDAECLWRAQAFIDGVGDYDGPPAELLCLLRAWGPAVLLGAGTHGSWPVLLGRLTNASVVYAFGIGRDLSWEAELGRRVEGVAVHVFDGTPLGAAWAADQPPAVRGNVTIHDWCLGAGSGKLLVRPVSWKDEPVGTYTAMKSVAPPYNFRDKATRVPMKGLAASMVSLGHRRLDVLKISVEGMEFGLLKEWTKRRRRLPVCQLLIRLSGDSVEKENVAAHQRAFRQLEKLGFFLVSCTQSHTNIRCLFVRPAAC